MGQPISGIAGQLNQLPVDMQGNVLGVGSGGLPAPDGVNPQDVATDGMIGPNVINYGSPGMGGKGPITPGGSLPGMGGKGGFDGAVQEQPEAQPVANLPAPPAPNAPQGATLGRPSPSAPMTPRGPGFNNPGAPGVQGRPLTGNFGPNTPPKSTPQFISNARQVPLQPTPRPTPFVRPNVGQGGADLRTKMGLGSGPVNPFAGAGQMGSYRDKMLNQGTQAAQSRLSKGAGRGGLLGGK